MGSDKNIKPEPGMGVSSERTGHAGPGQEGVTHGLNPTGIVEPVPDPEDPPEPGEHV